MSNKEIILLIIIMLFGMAGCSFLGNNNILKTIDIDDSKCEIENEVDTHGGFLGDGDYFAKIKCSDLKYEELSNNWKELPLSDELNYIMEMEQCDNKDCKNVYEKYSIPEITNGYYYFLDRHSESSNKYDDTDLNNRSSWNFTLAILDKDTNTIYYYEFDS